MRFNISFIILKIHIRFIPCKLLCSIKLYRLHRISKKQPGILSLSQAASVPLCIYFPVLCVLGFLMPFLPLLLINKVAGDSYEYHSA